MRAIYNPDCAETELTPEDHLVLIKRIAEKRDRDAFQALFLHFGPRVKAIMQQSGADPELAEDLVQEVMLTVWSKVHLYAAERGTVSTWIYTIARNARIDRFRRRSSRFYQDLDTIEVASEECGGEDTYDLTNYATLKNWPLLVSVADIAWGTFLTGICAAAGYWVARLLTQTG